MRDLRNTLGNNWEVDDELANTHSSRRCQSRLPVHRGYGRAVCDHILCAGKREHTDQPVTASPSATSASVVEAARCLPPPGRWPHAQSVAVADCYRDRRNGIAAVSKGKAYQDFRDLLTRKDIDAVVVATPDHWHVPICELAANAGKHVYLEKPLGLTIQQNLRCQQLFQQTGLVFQYGTQQRSMPHCFQACELVRRGAVGEIHTIEVDAPNGGVGGATAEAPDRTDWIMTCGLALRLKRPYTADRCKPPGTYWIYDQSIGYLAGWGAHPLDLMVWGSDADLSGPITVEGTGTVPQRGTLRRSVQLGYADQARQR